MPVYHKSIPVSLPVLSNIGAQALPIPSLDTDGASIVSAPRRRRSDVADIIVARTGGTSFILPGPVFVYAFTPDDSGFATVDLWLNADTLEVTGMDLTDALNGGSNRGKSYRMKISPYWTRLALVAPNWLFAAGQTIRILYRPYVD